MTGVQTCALPISNPLIHAHSLLQGGRAIARSSLVGGHAGGMSGLEGGKDETDSKKIH